MNNSTLYIVASSDFTSENLKELESVMDTEFTNCRLRKDLPIQLFCTTISFGLSQKEIVYLDSLKEKDFQLLYWCVL